MQLARFMTSQITQFSIGTWNFRSSFQNCDLCANTGWENTLAEIWSKYPDHFYEDVNNWDGDRLLLNTNVTNCVSIMIVSFRNCLSLSIRIRTCVWKWCTCMMTAIESENSMMAARKERRQPYNVHHTHTTLTQKT